MRILCPPASYRRIPFGRLNPMPVEGLPHWAGVGLSRVFPRLISSIVVGPSRACLTSRGRVTGVLLALCLIAAPAAVIAQNPSPATAPAVQGALPAAPQPQALGAIHGTVTNPAGAPVSGIQVALAGTALAAPQTNITGRNGEFTFGNLAAGTYSVSASGPGFEPVDPTQVELGAGEDFRLPITIVPMPKVVSTVRVTAYNERIATEQVKQETQQRVFAIIPNFSTSYEWDAAPLTAKLKFRLEARTLIDPFTIFSDAAIAGAEQYHNTFPGYGGGWPGYGKRFGATLADSFDARIIGDAVLPSIFHQDPRYFYHGGPDIHARVTYALRETVMCRGDDQRQQFCVSRILGDLAAAGLANLYHAPGDRGVGITFRDTFIVLGGDAIGNEVREFLTRAITSHKPSSNEGKPEIQ